MTYAIKLEKFDEAFRATIMTKSDDGFPYVVDVFEAEQSDPLWANIHRFYHNLNAVFVDGEFVEPDCLTVREAAEAAMIERVTF